MKESEPSITICPVCDTAQIMVLGIINKHLKRDENNQLDSICLGSFRFAPILSPDQRKQDEVHSVDEVTRND